MIDVRKKALRAAAALGCTLAALVPAAAAAVLEGRVTFRERIALPPDTVLAVRLRDAARQDVAAETLVETRAVGLEGPPYVFALAVGPALFDARRELRAEATLSAGGRVLMRSIEAYPITEASLAEPLEILVQGVGAAAAGADLALLCRGNEPFWSLEIDGARARFSSLAGAWPSGADLAGVASRLDWAEPERFAWRGSAPLGEPLVAVGRRESCLDTMADRPPYPWAVTLVGPDGRAHLGCCEPPE